MPIKIPKKLFKGLVKSAKPKEIIVKDSYFSDPTKIHRFNSNSEAGSLARSMSTIRPHEVSIQYSVPAIEKNLMASEANPQHTLTVPEIPDILSPQTTISTYHFDPRVRLLSRPISEAEKLGIPKAERSNAKALEDPYYWGYQQWNNRYNTAINSGNLQEAQRLRALHFMTKAPNTKIIETAGMPKEVYHGSVGSKFTVFDSSKKRPDYDYGTSTNMFSDNKNVALNYANNDPDKLHSVYLNLQNILERDFKGNSWNGSVNNSGKFQIVPAYGTTYSSEQEAETALQKILDQYYPNDPVKQAEQRHYMYVIELMDPPHPERSTNAFSDEINSIPTLDGGIIKNVTDYYELPRFDENPKLYKELVSPHIDYFVKDPRNIKSSAITTYDNNGKMIQIVKRDNFHNPDIRYKQGGILKGQFGLSHLSPSAINQSIDRFKQTKVGTALNNFFNGTDSDLSNEEYIQKHGYAKPKGGIGILGAVVAPEWEGVEGPIVAENFGYNGIRGPRPMRMPRPKVNPAPKPKQKPVSNWERFLQNPVEKQDAAVRTWNAEKFKSFNELKQNPEELRKFKYHVNNFKLNK